MIIFLDTETSDKYSPSLGLFHPDQPHIVQLGALLCNDDEECSQVSSLNAIVKPRGWKIAEGALKVHHITEEYARTFGEELEDVLARLLKMAKEADNAARSGDGPQGRLICHNHEFDSHMLHRDIEFSFLGDKRGAHESINLLFPFCTMRAMTSQCKLPGRFPGKYKWPRLYEAYEFVFGVKPSADTAHSAMGDLLACRDIFVEGRKRGWWR